MPRLPHPAPEDLRRERQPLRGRTALVTGAGRRSGIGHTVARRLAAYGASVHLHHHVPHDSAMPWGADRTEDVVASAPAELVATAVSALGGRLDIVVAHHTLSVSDGTLDTIDAAMLDAHRAVETRSVLLLVQAHARHRA